MLTTFVFSIRMDVWLVTNHTSITYYKGDEDVYYTSG